MVLGLISWFIIDLASFRIILLKVLGITSFLKKTSVVSAWISLKTLGITSVITVLGASSTLILTLALEITVNRVLVVVLLLRNKLVLLYYLVGFLFDIYYRSQPSNNILVQNKICSWS
jgi:hypothetical protein